MFNKEKPVEITFDSQKCNNSGLCAEACSVKHLIFENKKVKINDNSILGCVQCGHCMMACPNDAISVKGEGISPEDILPLDNNYADYNALYSLLTKRRSTRKFQDKEVPKEIIDKILKAASTGAISLPPSEVKVLVINGKDKVQEFADDIIDSLKKMFKLMNKFTLTLFKPFIGEIKYKMLAEFVLPLIKLTIEERKNGLDNLFYKAPSLMIFYTTPLSDKDDALIASSLATVAAESLGVGTCIIGIVPHALTNNVKFKAKYGILKDETVHSAFILGYPEKTFSKGITRSFKEVKYL